jgi:hypothetical protein
LRSVNLYEYHENLYILKAHNNRSGAGSFQINGGHWLNFMPCQIALRGGAERQQQLNSLGLVQNGWMFLFIPS